VSHLDIKGCSFEGSRLKKKKKKTDAIHTLIESTKLQVDAR
jgi:hypothetical protein